MKHGTWFGQSFIFTQQKKEALCKWCLALFFPGKSQKNTRPKGGSKICKEKEKMQFHKKSLHNIIHCAKKENFKYFEFSKRI